MTSRKVTRPTLFFTLGLVVSVLAVGCGGGAPAFEVEQATTLIKAQFPEADLEVRTARIDEQGKGIAFARFNDQVVNFIFAPADDGWTLEAVDFDGSVYLVGDLEQISTTMQAMAEVAGALERFKVANSGYPTGESVDVLQALVPGFLPAETAFNDSWEQVFSYDSEGNEYTLISYGADKTSGTRDDIVLHSGEFVGAGGAGGGGGQGQD